MPEEISHKVPSSHKDVAVQRFLLKNGQIFEGEGVKENLWWVLDGTTIGLGDLRLEDIERIQRTLNDGEVFIGWHEYHGLPDQPKEPVVHITKKEITYPYVEPKEEDGGEEEPG